MISSKSVPKSGEGAGLWFLKILTGLLIIIILGVHFTVNHMLGSMAGGLLSYEDVLRYYAQNPIIPIMEILFILFVVPHSLLGLRSILLDLRPSAGALKAINWTFIVFGVIAVVYGIGLIVVLVQRGASL
jgi:succinate dehydrogenase / fumarate reductase membrane anchor subunit